MAQFTGLIDLTDLDPSEGFVIQGPERNVDAGFSVSSAGDVNGDGFADVIVGAPRAGLGHDGTGEAYVIFGKAGGFGTIDVADLAATDGFIIQGVERSYTGFSVSGAGDLNGDGFDDVIVGAPDRYSGGGAAHVIFGQADHGNINITDLQGTDGFIIRGLEYTHTGASVSGAGDVNGDGFEDIIVGAPFANDGSGEAYVVFGGADGFGTIDVRNFAPTDGFIIQGGGDGDAEDWNVSGAGDVNGDGFDDIIVGASGDGDRPEAADVIFGRDGGFDTIDATELTSADGFIIRGDEEDGGGRDGFRVSAAGDVNGDGIADVIVGAPGVVDRGGEAYVIFGRAGGRDTVDPSDLAATDGFIIQGLNSFARFSVSTAGDVNGDGFDDVIVGESTGAGEAYVIFGRAGGFDTIDLSDLPATDGFVIQGDAALGAAGRSVSAAGDVNGDGFDDLIVGAPYAGDNDNRTGEAYVIFGRQQTEDALTLVGAAGDQTILGGTQGDTISGLGGNDRLVGFEGDDTLNGGEGDDVLEGGAGADTLDGGTQDTLGDTLSYASSVDGVRVSLQSGRAALGDAAGDTISNFENLIGSSARDVLIGNAVANVIEGGDGNDTIHGLGGNDDIFGGEGNDVLEGGAGADTLDGGANDTLGDTLSYARSVEGVRVSLDSGRAALGDAAGDTISNFENLIGSSARDVLIGDAGANVIEGGEGNDTIDGLGGNDEIFGGEGADRLFGGSGDDTLHAGEGEGNVLIGGTGRDVLIGGGERDVLRGGASADTLNGDDGNDVYFGGFGADQFVFNANDGNDVINDFEDHLVNERIDLSSLGITYDDLTIVDLGTSGDARIDYGSGTIRVTDTVAADLGADDFIFV